MFYFRNKISQIFSLNIIPIVVIQLALLPLWLFGSIMAKSYISIFGTLLSIILYPLYLSIINYKLSISQKSIEWIIKSISTPLAILICSLLHYFNWGISSGNLFSPDIKTIELVKLEIIYGLSISIILFVLSSLMAKIKIEDKMKANFDIKTIIIILLVISQIFLFYKIETLDKFETIQVENIEIVDSRDIKRCEITDGGFIYLYNNIGEKIVMMGQIGHNNGGGIKINNSKGQIATFIDNRVINSYSSDSTFSSSIGRHPDNSGFVALFDSTGKLYYLKEE